ncbi:hypothetical protein EJB05_35482, partial [Eragrostis curvula]
MDRAMWRMMDWAMVVMAMAAFVFAGGAAEAAPATRRILMDMDMDIDDFFAMLYILKQNRSEFELKNPT